MRKLVVENFSVKETVTKSANRMSVVAGFNLRIRARLIAGFVAICAILVGVVGVTTLQVSKVDGVVERINTLRVPTAAASGAMVRVSMGHWRACAAGCSLGTKYSRPRGRPFGQALINSARC